MSCSVHQAEEDKKRESVVRVGTETNRRLARVEALLEKLVAALDALEVK